MPITLDGTLGITTPALTVDGATVNTGGISTAGNLTFTSTGNRILGDFSNSTIANRVMFQSSTTNNQTSIGVLPNGTSTTTNINLFGGTDPANASFAQLVMTGSEARLNSGITGTGTYLPLTMYTGGSERLRIDTSGNVGIGTSTPASKLQVTASTSNCQMFIGYTDNNNYYQSNSLQVFGNYNGSTATMTVDTGNQKVGIGTNSPASKFDVTGIARFSSTAFVGPSSGKGVELWYQSDSDKGFIGAFDRGGSVYKPMQVFGSQIELNISGVEAMRVIAGGNVGVGTSSPTNKLQASGDSVRIAAQNATTNGECELEAQVYNYWSGSGGPTYTGTAIVQWGAGASGTTAGVSNANLGILRFQNGSGGLIYTNGGSPIVFATTSSERMRITASGSVGIGTSSPIGLLTVRPGTDQNFNVTSGTTYGGADGVSIFSVNDANSAYKDIAVSCKNLILNASGGNGYVGIATGTPQGYLDVACGSTSAPTYKGAVRVVGGAAAANGGLELLNTTYASGYGWRLQAPDEGGGSTPLLVQGRSNSAAWTEYFRFDNTGLFCVGAAGYVGGGITRAGLSLFNQSGTSGRINVGKTLSGTAAAMQFNYNGTEVGTINYTDTATAFNTSSDYRLKENVAPMQGALKKVAALKPVTYTWKIDGSSGQGFIAHELAEVVPDCVTGEKDAVDAEGKPVYQGIDTSFLVATLTKAIQEQQVLIEQLTTRLNALEGK